MSRIAERLKAIAREKYDIRCDLIDERDLQKREDLEERYDTLDREEWGLISVLANIILKSKE